MDADEKKPQDTVDAGEMRAVSPGTGHLARKLGGKEVQLFAIGGAIGTTIFITMGTYLPCGGPAGLLIGFGLWCANMWCISECFAEMTVYAPVPSAFVTFTSFWVDEALAFAQSWAFFLCQAFLVPAEIIATHTLITFWTDKLPVEATVIIVLFLYCILNLFSVKWFGTAEFYLSIGKVLLIFIFFSFTFFTMVGANPSRDAYGFRYWYERETMSPRRILPTCFRNFKWRLLFFFVGSAVCIRIVIPYNDPKLAAFICGEASGSGTSAASPYTIAMERMNTPGLSHLANALMLTSVVSCGNGVLYAASHTLYGMAKDGRAPKIFSETTKRGVPVYAAVACLLFGLLSIMGTNTDALDVLYYFVDLCTICGQFNYMCACIAYIHFHFNPRKQGISRDTLPYKAKFQPYRAYIGTACAILAMLFLGFDVLSPFSVQGFFLDYTLLGVFPVAALLWNFIRKTKYVRIGTADLGLGGLVKEVDDYEDLVVPEPESWFDKIFSGSWTWKDLRDALLKKDV